MINGKSRWFLKVLKSWAGVRNCSITEWESFADGTAAISNRACVCAQLKKAEFTEWIWEEETIWRPLSFSLTLYPVENTGLRLFRGEREMKALKQLDTECTVVVVTFAACYLDGAIVNPETAGDRQLVEHFQNKQRWLTRREASVNTVY